MNFKDLQIRRFLAIIFLALKAFSGFFSSSNPCEPGPKFNSADCSAVIGEFDQLSNWNFFRSCRTRFWMELLNIYTVKYWTASSSIVFKFSFMRNMTFPSWPIKQIIYRSAVMILRSYSYIYRHDILNIFSDVKNRFPMVQFGKTFGPANLISKRRYKMLFQRRGWLK